MQNANIFRNFSAGGISCSADAVSVSSAWLRSELEEPLGYTSFGGVEGMGFEKDIAIFFGSGSAGIE